MVRLNPRSLRVLNQEGGTDTMHSVEGADHVGAFLREARETTGRSVADVAQTLRIRRAYLEAIEDGRFDELPGAAYAVGFVRTYANHLRLDAPAVVARFKEEASGIEAPQELDFPTPVPEGRFPGGIVVTLSLLVAAGVFGGWYWLQNQGVIEIAAVPPPPVAAAPEEFEPARDAAPNQPVAVAGPASAGPLSADDSSADPGATAEEAGAAIETPDTDVPLVPPSYLRPQVDPLAAMADFQGEATAPPAPPPAETTAVTAPEAPVNVTLPSADTAQEVAASPQAPAEVPVPEESTDVPPPDAARSTSSLQRAPGAPPVPAETPPQVASLPSAPAVPRLETSAESTGRTYGVVNRDARIVIDAHENAWVQVRDGAENVVLTQMLQPGDRYFVPNRAGLRLMTGNAGGLAITVDGETVPAIGARGEARRDVRLEADLLKNGQAVIR